MKEIALLLLLTRICISFDIPKTGCQSDLTIDKNHYNRTKIYDVGFAYPTDAHYDTYGNLFFVLYGRNFSGYHFDIKIIKNDTTEPENIPGLPEGKSYSIAVDKKTANVYFGTSEGIFLYNYEKETSLLVSKPDLKLNNLYLDKDGNKYITDSSNGDEELYLLIGDKKIRFRSLDALNEMAIDDNNNFYYIKKGKLYVSKSDISRSILIGNVSYYGIGQISFHEDTIFVASTHLSYIHENDTGPLKLVKNISEIITAISFDHSGNFVLGSYGKISRYEIQDKECYHRRN